MTVDRSLILANAVCVLNSSPLFLSGKVLVLFGEWGQAEEDSKVGQWQKMGRVCLGDRGGRGRGYLGDPVAPDDAGSVLSRQEFSQLLLLSLPSLQPRP